MNIKKILFFILLLSLNFTNVFSIEPDVFVQSTVNRASAILSKNMTKEEKINELKLIAKETVDIVGVGFYSLGSARKNLNENQKEQYLNLFEKYFLKSFSSRLSEYTNPKIEVEGKKKINENYTIVINNSKVVYESKENQFEYNFKNSKLGAPKIFFQNDSLLFAIQNKSENLIYLLNQNGDLQTKPFYGTTDFNIVKSNPNINMIVGSYEGVLYNYKINIMSIKQILNYIIYLFQK